MNTCVQCPPPMRLRLLADRAVCLRWSAGRHRIDVWVHDGAQLVLVGVACRRRQGGWNGTQPGGAQVADGRSLASALVALVRSPLVAK